MPVGIKDIFDTADMPTENGTPLHPGPAPRAGRTVVARLRAAGAVIIGKTVTTEFAYFHAGQDAQPARPARTPGGSSSGSAAAVAAGMVPLALGIADQRFGDPTRPRSAASTATSRPRHDLAPRRPDAVARRSIMSACLRARSPTRR